MKVNIAIDGPSAAGKSTIAKKLAKKLNYIHIDTGSMYRLVAYKALKNGIALDDIEGLMAMLNETDIELKADGSILLDGHIMGNEIRTNEMSIAASKVSKHKEVRADLVKRQQLMAQNKGYIMDGRDIGSVVLKDAELKIFLTASAKARAKRRHEENLLKNIPSDFEQLTREIEERDYQDTHRANSPLIKVEDAYLVDSSDLTIDEVVLKIENLLKEKGVNYD